MSRSLERATRNELIFRDANERIEESRQELGIHDVVPFVCECEDESCRELVRLSPKEYHSARVSPRHFLLAVGHPFRTGRVVSENDRFMVVEKQGEAARIAERDGQPDVDTQAGAASEDGGPHASSDGLGACPESGHGG